MCYARIASKLYICFVFDGKQAREQTGVIEHNTAPDEALTTIVECKQMFQLSAPT